MEKIEIEKIKEIELDMLKYLRDICVENNIHYFLACGTLLGAVRHKGFIPWDDDIDVYMPRKDYEKFILIAKNVKPECIFKATSIDEGYYFSFTKIINKQTVAYVEFREVNSDNIGIWIDVFPIDGVSKLPFMKNMQFWNIHLLCIVRGCLLMPLQIKDNLIKNLIKKFIMAIVRLLSNKRRAQAATYVSFMIDRIASIYSYENCNEVANLVDGYGKNEISQRALFEKSIEMEFEGEKFAAPIGYHEHLTNLYGDYMKLPAPEERVYKHQIEAYWRDDVESSKKDVAK